MFWADKIAADTQGYQVVNDSKTPSGRVHVGSLRGVVIHDVIYRALKHAGKPVKFMYGVDDYDALDTVPKYLDKEKFKPYLGYPLCNVPSPGEGASDYAKYFIGEFFEIFEYLGIKPETYFLRDLYRSGQLNSHIDTFLKNAHLVREAYKEVSKGDRPDNWYPFQVICENCGKIATTVTTDYNGSEVFYTCEPDATNYVKGCGHSGWVSPFNGNGKLPWKVEWVAKWDVLGVTIEMAGKDHSQKGGSRDVANAISRKVLQKQPPFHSPYEFILVNGTKMSSSKGVGSSAREIADLLPPELLRFLMLRTQPRTVINFAPNYETITRLFRDYDTLISKYQDNSELTEELMSLFYAQLGDEVKPFQPFDYSTLISLLQVPRLNIQDEVVQRTANPLTEYDQFIVDQRIASAQKWLQDYADEEEKLVLYLEQVPEKANTLNAEQVSYVQKLAENLENAANWEAEELQTVIFSTTKELQIPPANAFKALYLAFLNKERGPKAGGLFSYLEKSFVISRLQEVVALNAEKFVPTYSEEKLVPVAQELTKLPEKVTVTEPEAQWQTIFKEIAYLLDQTPVYLSNILNQYKKPVFTLLLLLSTLIILKVLLAVLDAINDIPLLSQTFELVGIGYSIWFTFRYLLQSSTRKESVNKLKSLKQQILGENMSKDS